MDAHSRQRACLEMMGKGNPPNHAWLALEVMQKQMLVKNALILAWGRVRVHKGYGMGFKGHKKASLIKGSMLIQYRSRNGRNAT